MTLPENLLDTLFVRDVFDIQSETWGDGFEVLLTDSTPILPSPVMQEILATDYAIRDAYMETNDSLRLYLYPEDKILEQRENDRRAVDVDPEPIPLADWLAEG
ncbi:hypothetical protein C457_13454 [Haloferax prahovense DSM 18310]|uniref:Uncharacterized protein n=1 Tax=Haloferax prahovense (strain DSM 18310 / JCM 13924 / TL6) TaxID=1227461 RepID=M0G461_HALPT|nr:hypothetical protein [Haloferax prahovense]ELZ67046.1 hypothetical protein C457_13454 [Haloferax prahovense DSM 18310]